MTNIYIDKTSLTNQLIWGITQRKLSVTQHRPKSFNGCERHCIVTITMIAINIGRLINVNGSSESDIPRELISMRHKLMTNTRITN